MHTVDKLSLNSGLKPKKPFILEELFPLPFERYVLIHMENVPSRNYHYFQDVVDIIRPILDKENIRVIQVGDNIPYLLEEVIPLCGGLTTSQLAYMIKNSMCVVTTSDFVSQICGSYDTNLVQLFSDSHEHYTGSYFSSKENFRSIKFGDKTTFDKGNHLSDINKILPTTIVDNILDLLDVENTFPFKEVKVGKRYVHRSVEMVPDSTVDIQSLKIDSIIVRMDLKHDEKILEEQLKKSVCNIITKKPINLEILEKYRTKIKELAILVDDIDYDFVENSFELGLNVYLISNSDNAKIKELKLKYLDLGTIIHNEKPNIELEDKENLFFKTKKLTYSKGKLYVSEQHYFDGHPSRLGKEISKVKMSDKFWEDSEYYTLYRKIK